MPELDPMKRWLTWTVYATPLMTLTVDLDLSIRVSMFEHVDCDWDLFWARGKRKCFTQSHLYGIFQITPFFFGNQTSAFFRVG